MVFAALILLSYLYSFYFVKPGSISIFKIYIKYAPWLQNLIELSASMRPLCSKAENAVPAYQTKKQTRLLHLHPYHFPIVHCSS